MLFGLLIRNTGRDPSVLPGVGASIRDPVHPVAFDIYEILVCATCPVLGHSKFTKLCQDISAIWEHTVSGGIWVLLCHLLPWVQQYV